MRTFYLNPFYMFSLSFIVAISLFYLGISNLYSNVGYGDIEAVVLLILLSSLIFGFFYKLKLNKYVANSITHDSSKFNIFVVSVFIFFGALLEIWASGVVPILTVITGSSYEYRNFGIASFHVFFLSYVSASAIISYERYLTFGTKRNLILTTLALLFSITIVNRAAMIMIILPCFLMYLSHNKNLKAKVIIASLFIGIIIAFGFIGDKRMVSSGYTDEKPIFRISEIENPIMQSIPSGFTWFYVYISSPYANLINQDKNDRYGKGDFMEFLNVAILPDFVSKRLDENVKNRFNPSLITPELQVTTGFGWSAIIYGISGIALTYVYMCILIVFFSFTNRKKNIRTTSAILATASALMIFNNMFVFAACIMQLVLISLLCGRRFTIQGKTVNIL